MFTSSDPDCALHAPAVTIETNTAAAVARIFVFMGVSFFISTFVLGCLLRPGAVNAPTLLQGRKPLNAQEMNYGRTPDEQISCGDQRV
jgi:hypothetical protein